jgi:hypothetical protein
MIWTVGSREEGFIQGWGKIIILTNHIPPVYPRIFDPSYEHDRPVGEPIQIATAGLGVNPVSL